LGDQPWEQHIRRVTTKVGLRDLHFGLTNLPTTLFRYLWKMPFEGTNRHLGVTTPTTFTRWLRKMPGFESCWFSFPTSSAETLATQGNAVSWQNSFDLRVRAGRERISLGLGMAA
jgi:hypothetical protein